MSHPPRSRRAALKTFGSLGIAAALPGIAMAQADVIVTQSRAETRLLEADAGMPLPHARVAHNGVDPWFFEGSAARGRSIVGEEPFVLSVGRVEPRKNQLTLARAMRSVPQPIWTPSRRRRRPLPQPSATEPRRPG